MKKIIALVIFSFVIYVSQSGPFNNSASNDVQKNYNGLKVIELTGNFYQIGKQHGQKLKNEIAEIISLWKQNLENTYDIDAETFISNFYENTNYFQAIEKWTPGFLREIRGISDGAEIDFKTVFVYQLIDEIWVAGSEITEQHKCTTIGVSKHNGNPSMVAQNLDIPRFYHNYQTLLKINNTETNISAYVFTVAGIIGANGINSYSVGVDVNTITQLRHCTDGLPVDCVVRGILEQKSYADAVQFINEIKHASGQNYLIGGINEVGSFECSAGNVAKYTPFEEAYFTYHTNHPLANMDFDPALITTLRDRYGHTPEEHVFQCSRFNVLEERIKNYDGDVDLDLIKQTLRSKEGNGATINNSSTFGSTIMILKKNPELLIVAGSPSENEYIRFSLNGENFTHTRSNKKSDKGLNN
ncbi:C45 family autoproteolytic acyltransferase/hydrolase [Bacteroidota bacterium]